MIFFVLRCLPQKQMRTEEDKLFKTVQQVNEIVNVERQTKAYLNACFNGK